jgi:hypothetical protein
VLLSSHKCVMRGGEPMLCVAQRIEVRRQRCHVATHIEKTITDRRSCEQTAIECKIGCARRSDVVFLELALCDTVSPRAHSLPTSTASKTKSKRRSLLE